MRMEPLEKAFFPYKTMWKLEGRSVSRMEFDLTPRCLVCLNCEAIASIRELRASDSDVTHNKCPYCKMTAGRYWAKKVCRRVPDDAT